jgi:hypothetical protein
MSIWHHTLNKRKEWKMKTNKTEQPKETLEQFKSKVALNNVKTHYKYALVITNILTAAIFIIVGYFLSIQLINDASSRVVNSIEVSVKDNQ